jgi:hypothetical protein
VGKITGRGVMAAAKVSRTFSARSIGSSPIARTKTMTKKKTKPLTGKQYLDKLEEAVIAGDVPITRQNFTLARAFLLKHFGRVRRKTIDQLAIILDYLEESERA